MTAIETRQEILKRLSEDLIGPHSPEEILETRPLDVYLTGILWPLESTMESDDDDGALDDEDDAEEGGQVAVFGQMKPSTMGITFGVKTGEVPRFTIEYEFAGYLMSLQEDDSGKKELWQRKHLGGMLEHELTDEQDRLLKLDTSGTEVDVRIHIRNKSLQDLRLVTVTLINYSSLEEGDKIDGNLKSIFQTGLKIRITDPLELVGLPDDRLPIDEDEKSTQLLYSEELSYAVGHQCSATWSPKDEKIREIETSWIPVETVPMFSQAGHAVFANVIKSGGLSAKSLATSSRQEVVKTLFDLSEGYEKWVNIQKENLSKFSKDFRLTGERHINECHGILDRIRKGIKVLESDDKAFGAFQIANQAMALQHSWKFTAHDPMADLAWRPFQIAFILLTLDSICNRESEDRETLDLLWFPTGGGKTEAYLALIAFGATYKRLKNETQGVWGNYAIMRYTLRLLTAQQFERASAMILALELIRRESNVENRHFNLGETSFSIGLWVGDGATPNRYETAKKNKQAEFGSTAEQILKCYICKSKLHWVYSDDREEVRPKCISKDCALGPTFGLWPVSTVDDDIYRLRPTLLIGTVDKFAQLPRKAETRALFGFKSANPSELIIQDELHLISGPLGTIVGAYEMAIDWLLTSGGVRPKVIGSTATIRRAQSQVRALFDRKSAQFPPPGLTYKDSGFAVIDEEKPGRLYVGLSNAGRSAKFSLQAIAGSLLQSGGLEKLGDVKSRDGYSTLLMYFNNLRELGAAIVQVLDDVSDSIDMFARRRGEEHREIDPPRELTSTRTQSEIIEILEDLNKKCDSPEKIDVVLATNMVSVGVDVPRLGLMQVNGQPKTRSEYIQATSRVGRSDSPGLVIVVHNVLRARDRSHFETFANWHRRLYRDVEATSVTPFASRARDRTLRTIIASMVRHSDPKMLDDPKLENANPKLLQQIVAEIERRVAAVEPGVLGDVSKEIDEILNEWQSRDVRYYLDEKPDRIKNSLLQRAERYVQKIAAGSLPGYAWPIMGAMRSVEPSTPFRLKERVFTAEVGSSKGESSGDSASVSGADTPPWRQKNE